MRKYVTILCLALLSMPLLHARVITSGNRWKVDNYHFGYVSLSGGYTSLTQNVMNVTTKGDWGALAGAGYEFRRSSAWVSVGLQYQMLQSMTTVDAYRYLPTQPGLDDQHKAVQYMYEINQVDRQQWRSIDIPIMAGYYNSGFYVGAGLKVGFSAGSSILTRGTYKISGDYDRYVGVFEDVNYYKEYTPADKSYACNLRPQFAIIGEIGYDLLSNLSTNSRICHVLKLGYYFEWGLSNVHPIDAREPLQINPQNATQAEIVPYYLSTQTEGNHVAPFYVGLKLTYMVGGSRSTTATYHTGCQCYGR